LAKKEVVQKAIVSTQETEDNKAIKFVDETKEELGKVVWPSRQQLLSESAAVLSMVVLVSLVIYLVDNLFSWGAGKVF
jgi:preprotein translocase subunit SecE